MISRKPLVDPKSCQKESQNLHDDRLHWMVHLTSWSPEKWNKKCAARLLPIFHPSEESLWLISFAIKKYTLGMVFWHDRIWKIGQKSQFSPLDLDYLFLWGLSSIQFVDFKSYFGNDFGDLWLSYSQLLISWTHRSFHSLKVSSCPLGQIRNLFNLSNGLATITEAVCGGKRGEN